MRSFGYLLPCCILVVNGCTAFSNTRKAIVQVTDTRQQSEALLREMQQAERQQTRVHQRPWVSKKAIKRQVARIPPELNCEITFATGTPMPLSEFSALMNKLCGLPVRITPDAEAKLAVGGQEDKGRRLVEPEQKKLSGIRWQGKLDGLLDAVTSSFGLSWRYSDGEISLYYLDTRTFYIFAIPSETEMRSVVQSGMEMSMAGGSDGSSKGQGQSSQTTAVSLKSAVVQDICKSIQSMLTPEFGRFSPSLGTGTITVTDTPEVLSRIQRYVDTENRSITKQVLLNVKVVTVTLDDVDQFDINWELVYQTSNKLSGAIKGAKSALEAGTGFNTTINILEEGGKFNNSKLLLDALATQGKVALVTSPSVTTLNLQPVPVQVGTETTYIASIENNSTAGVGNSVSVSTSKVSTGFNMNLLPFVMPDNQLLLQYAINLSELKRLHAYEISGGDNIVNKIQAPEIENRIFSQKVKLRSGQTLVLSGFEQTRDSAERQGTGMAGNWLLGGGVKAQQKRDIIVIMITPIVME